VIKKKRFMAASTETIHELSIVEKGIYHKTKTMPVTGVGESMFKFSLAKARRSAKNTKPLFEKALRSSPLHH